MSKRSLFDKTEYLFVLVAMLVLTEALTPIILFGSAGNASLTDSNPASLLSALAVYCVALLYLARQPYTASGVIISHPLLVCLFLLPLISSFWSDDPMVTARRAIALALTGILCVYFAIRLSPEEFLRRLLVALFIGGVASLILAAVLPHLAIGTTGGNIGAWHGVYGHKAILGRIAAVAVAVVIYVRPKSTWGQVIRWATLAIFLFLSVMSESRTSWVLIAGVCVLALVLSVIRSRTLSVGLRTGFSSLIAIGFLVVAFVGFEILINSLGRDDTFSGRTTLWYGATEVAVTNHPIIGAGYRSFWVDSRTTELNTYIHWKDLPDHGHNGYLDLWLELGVPGVVFFTIFVFVVLSRLFHRVVDPRSEAAWAGFLTLFIVFLVNNASASVALTHTDIAWSFAVLGALYARGSLSAKSPVTSAFKFGMRSRCRVDPIIPPFAGAGGSVPT